MRHRENTNRRNKWARNKHRRHRGMRSRHRGTKPGGWKAKDGGKLEA